MTDAIRAGTPSARRAFATALSALGVLLAAAATAQEPAAPADATAEAFFEVVEVSIANIDVWVTDKAGAPVEGLTRDDFVVLRDGQEVPIANFYAVSGGRPALPGGEPRAGTTPDLPAAPKPHAEAAQLAPEHRLWLIVYVDNFNLDPLERNRILPQLRTFLRETLDAGDRAMVVKATRSVDVVLPFSSDGEEVGNSLAELFDDAGHATVRRRDQVDALRRIDATRDAGRALMYAQQYAEEQMNGVEYAAEALQGLIESLAGLPGRKALVHVSSGIPMSAGEEMFHVVGEKFDRAEAYAMIPRYDTGRTFERINQVANANRVAFYTIDAGGMRGMEFGKAEYGGFADPRIRKTLDSVVHESLQAPLRLMALETGGQSIVNQNNILPALDRAAQDFRSFYSLGIAAGSDVDRYHRVEVRLAQRRGDVVLRHREGYRSKSSDTRARERLRSALLYAQQDEAGGVRAEWGRAERGDDGNYLVPIRLHVPLRDVALLPTSPGKHEARLRLYFGAVGPDGEASAIESVPLGLRLADEHVEAARAESIVHTHRLVVNRGKRRLGVTVMDLAGGTSWVVTRTVHVGPTTPTD